MGLRDQLVRQFGNPKGPLGRVAGFIMSHRSSNRERIAWAVSLLDVSPEDSVLEIGFGPGVGIRMLAERAVNGMVCGVDRSALMLEQASRRNRKLIAAKRVQLTVASASSLPSFDRVFDKVLDVNTFQFWENQGATFLALKKVVRPGGMIALAHQPRNHGATEKDAFAAGERISGHLAASGYGEIRVEMFPTKPVATACVIARSLPAAT